jgi:hypothetical protein
MPTISGKSSKALNDSSGEDRAVPEDGGKVALNRETIKATVETSPLHSLTPGLPSRFGLDECNRLLTTVNRFQCSGSAAF